MHTPPDDGHARLTAFLHQGRGDAPGPDGLAALRGLLHQDLGGKGGDSLPDLLLAVPSNRREPVLHAYNGVVNEPETVAWIRSDALRRRRAEKLALRLSLPDPSPGHCQEARSAARGFSALDRYPYAVIVVPGYTPLDETVARPGVHPVAQRRLEVARDDFRAGKAPFVLVSGGNVYPRGTPYFEGVEMKRVLLGLGVPENRILVDARARHSTTNLRNAGRIMRELGLPRALVTTCGGGLFGTDLFDQDFYFSHPVRSRFHARCEEELGYRVGELDDAGPNHTSLVPSPDVGSIGWRDALDP